MAKKKKSSSVGSQQKSRTFWIAFGSTLLLLIIGVALWSKDRFVATPGKWSGKVEKVQLSEIPALKQKLFESLQGIARQKTTIRIERYQEQIKICRTILLSTNDPSDQEFAKKALLNAHNALFTLDESRPFDLPEVQASINELIEEFANDPNPEVRSATMEMAFRRGMILLGSREPTEESLADFETVIRKAAAENLERTEFVYKIGEVCDIYKLNDDKAPANARILRIMADAWGASPNAEVRIWAAGLQDEAALIEAGFYSNFAKAIAGERSAGEAMATMVPQLLAQNLSARGLDRILTIGEQFEMNGWLDFSQFTFESVLRHLATQEVTRKEELATKAQYGLKRLSLINQPFPYSARDVIDQEWSSEKSKGKLVLIVFIDKLEDINRLTPFRDRMIAMNKFGLQVHVVLMGQPTAADLSIIKNAEKTFSFFSDPDAQSDFFKNCPISAAPYMLLINSQGRVVDINISFQRLTKALEQQAFASPSNSPEQ